VHCGEVELSTRKWNGTRGRNLVCDVIRSSVFSQTRPCLPPPLSTPQQRPQDGPGRVQLNRRRLSYIIHTDASLHAHPSGPPHRVGSSRPGRSNLAHVQVYAIYRSSRRSSREGRTSAHLQPRRSRLLVSVSCGRAHRCRHMRSRSVLHRCLSVSVARRSSSQAMATPLT
jgi:hypothetical protein